MYSITRFLINGIVVDGYLVEPENVSAMVTAILRLMKNEEQRSKFGTRSHEIALQGYQLPVVQQQLIHLYKGEMEGL